MTDATVLSRPPDQYLEVAGCRTFLQRRGEGPPLLYLHGAGGGGVWHPFLESLSERFDVLAPEHPGFGRTDMPPWFDNIHDLAFFYLDLLRQLDLRDVQLVGCSLGGWIAAELAVRSTERLAALTLIGAAGIRVPGNPRPDSFLWTPEQAVRALYHDPAIAERALATPPSDEEIDRQLKNRFATAKVAWAPRFFDPHLEKWLHRIDVPTWIVWGDDDRLSPLEYGDRWRGLIPGAELTVIERAGHLPQVEQPDAFCREFHAFVERTTP